MQPEAASISGPAKAKNQGSGTSASSVASDDWYTVHVLFCGPGGCSGGKNSIWHAREDYHEPAENRIVGPVNFGSSALQRTH